MNVGRYVGSLPFVGMDKRSNQAGSFPFTIEIAQMLATLRREQDHSMQGKKKGKEFLVLQFEFCFT